MNRTHQQSGFALGVVLILSVCATIIGVTMLQAITSSRSDNAERYGTRLAQQAAEAGIAYASACLEKANHLLTWGSSNGGAALTQSTTCTGAASGSAPAYVLPSSGSISVRTSFSVGEPEVLNNTNAQIKSSGKAEVLISGTSTVTRTYNVVTRKVVVWGNSQISQRSSSGLNRTCGLLSSSVYCWGLNDLGQLGDGTFTDSLTPVTVVRQPYGPTGIGNHPVVALSSGGTSNCVIIDTGEVYCWGNNSTGQLAQGSLTPNKSSVPLRVSGLPVGDKAAQVSTGTSTCVLTEAGNLYCWGGNAQGQVGNSSTANQTSPVYIGGVNAGGFGALVNKKVIKLNGSGGVQNNTCVVAVDNQAYCWGGNLRGQLGIGTVSTSVTVPTAVSTSGVLGGKKVTDIASEGEDTQSGTGSALAHTCAIAYTVTTGDAKAYCWGSNSVGSIGNGSATCNGATTCNVPSPVAVDTSGLLNGLTVSELSTSRSSSCVIAYPPATPNSNAAYCWGQSATTGNATATGLVTTPIAVDATKFGTAKIDQLTGGGFRNCVRANNKAYCWGANSVGQIGDGTIIARKVPTEALFLRPRDLQFTF